MCRLPETLNALEFTQYPVGFGEPEMTEKLVLSFAAEEQALRVALAQVRDFLNASGFPESFLGNVELVLAEAVNNVIEHAYANIHGGQVEIRLEKTDSGIVVFLEDDGAAMPDGMAPEGRLHDLKVDLKDLPEGGFGWFLIRELTDSLEFNRIGNRNQLCVHMRVEPGSS